MKPIIDKYTSKTLSPKVLRWIKACLANDETSTNKELINYFTKSEPTVSKEEAELWVSRRSFYIRNTFIVSEEEPKVETPDIVITLPQGNYEDLMNKLDAVRKLSNLTNGQQTEDWNNLTKIASNISSVKKILEGGKNESKN